MFLKQPARFAAACAALVVSVQPARAQEPGEALALEWAAKASTGELLLLQASEFDPLDGLPPLGPEFASIPPAPADADCFLVQFAQPPSAPERAALAALGAEVLEYVPNNAYLVRAAPASLAAIVALEGVRASVPFAPAFRVDPRALALPEDEVRDWLLVLFDGEDFAPALAAVRRAGAVLRGSGGRGRLIVRAPRSLLGSLAAIRSLAWLQEAPQAALRRNDSTTWVVQSNVSGVRPLWAQGLMGQGQIVGHIDDPLDLNNCYFRDPAVPTAGPTHRKVITHNGSTSTSGDHGAHTAATSAGDQQPVTGSTVRNGIAYLARIAHTNLSLVGSGNLATPLQQLFDAGARVFTNSWGNDGTTAYDAWARDIDVFSWNNENALVMFAVSNLSTLKNPENAKNVLAVGATSQAPNQAARCYGGAGPTSDGRRKPEIYAPGCSIYSANAGTSCSTQSMSGTSMACPAITGAAALVRQYFSEGWYPAGAPDPSMAFTPSGALTKAVLLNSAVDMTGVSGYPSNAEGWGRLLLDNSLFFQGDAIKLCVADVRRAQGLTAAGQRRAWAVTIGSVAAPLEITLAWHDSPAALFAALTPVNNLNLRVTAPDGSVYLGNVFTSGQSATGGAADALNNVERVRLNLPLAGTWVVEVLAGSVPVPAQGFALAVSGDISECLQPRLVRASGPLHTR